MRIQKAEHPGKHCQPFTNSRMDYWKEDSRDDDAGTGIIALGRVEEEAEESALAHSYARVERQAGEVLLGGLPGSNCKRRGKATAWLRFVHSLRTMQCGTRYDRLPVPEHTWKKEGGLPQAIPCASLHETIQIGLNMFGLWVVDTNI